MAELTPCPQCGTPLQANIQFCPSCGFKIGAATPQPQVQSGSSEVSPQSKSEKSARAALLLALFLGPLGIHRFYVGKIGTGILMLLTGGGLGIWALIDIVLIASCEFKDKQGHPLIFERKSGSSSKSVLKIIGLVLVALVFYIGVIIFLALMLTSGLTNTARSQLEAIRQGDLVQAYAYTSQDFKNATSLEAFKQFVDQTPTLNNNESASFHYRKRVNNMGELMGTLTAQDGSTASVEYRLILENDEWKILGIHVTRNANGGQSSHQDPVEAAPLENTFKNSKNRYTVDYPNGWVTEQPEPATVTFAKLNQNDQSYIARVGIESLLTHKTGGSYKTVDDALADIKKQASKLPSFQLRDQGVMALPNNPENNQGKYILFSYMQQGVPLVQMNIIMGRDDQMLMYNWIYTATADHFDEHLDTIKQMFETWTMY